MEPARYRFDWTWPLIALCIVALVFVVAEQVSTFNGESRFWDVGRTWSGEPFVLTLGQPRAGGAAERAGIQKGDRLDIREQSRAMRISNVVGPRGTTPMMLIVRRGGRTIPIPFVGSTVWDGAPVVKLLYREIPAITGLFFLGCALLIATRRASQTEGRALALILLCLVPSGFPFLGNLPIADPILYVGFTIPLVPLALLIALSSRFGARNTWRTWTDVAAFVTIAAFFADALLSWYGLVTLRRDPLPFGYGLPYSIVSSAAAVFPLAAVIAAVASTPKEARARAGWLLLPLTTAISTSIPILYLLTFAQSWILFCGCYILSGTVLLLGALLVTYALLRRRVIDVGFVVSRTIVVAIVSLVVVAAFVLLEWALGTVLADASHATGVFANAALALVLGLSMRYIHRRVDSFVDSVMFRKRHEDERALRAFAKEASFITNSNSLFDLAIANVRSHTNATGAALLVNGDGVYRSVRGYGDVPVSANENDPAILALKARHKPLDPHNYETELVGDLALPVAARGYLHGVLLFEQRATGEAYAPDEIDALAEFAHGIGSAYDALDARTDEAGTTATAIDALRNTTDALRKSIERRFGPLE